MLNWIVYIKMDLALNNLQSLICHKTQHTNQFKFHSRYYVYFRANTLGKDMNPTLSSELCII